MDKVVPDLFKILAADKLKPWGERGDLFSVNFTPEVMLSQYHWQNSGNG